MDSALFRSPKIVCTVYGVMTSDRRNPVFLDMIDKMNRYVGIRC